MYKFENLSFKYTDKTILHQLSGHLDKGDICFLIGPNGSGKSTFFKVLSGYLNVPSPLKQKAAYLPAETSAQDNLTGYDILDIFYVKGSAWYKKENIDLLNIKSILKQRIKYLSSGEKRRIFLFSVLSHPSDIVLLDEPLTHLDLFYQFQLSKIIQNQNRDQRTFLISHHDFNWCFSFINSKTWVLNKGQFVFQGATHKAWTDSVVQNTFQIRSALLNNPLNSRQLLALSEMDRDTN